MKVVTSYEDSKKGNSPLSYRLVNKGKKWYLQVMFAIQYENSDEAIKPMDVVLYIRKDGAYVLHRVLQVREDCYVIRGDNCIAKEYVKQEQIVGVLTSFYRDEHFFSCENKGYQKYIRIWKRLSPIRIYLQKLRRRE